MNSQKHTNYFKAALTALVAVVSAALVLLGVVLMLFRPHQGESILGASDVGIMDGLDFFVFDSVSEA